MLKIKKIEFIKAVYDESLSHNIFSIANVYFSNYPPILGALIYWKKNNSRSEYTREGEYKFFYNLDDITYFAAVKFPKGTKLTRDQKQELSYILLDERGSIGTYTFKTHPSRRKRFNPKKTLEQLNMPENFDVTSIPVHYGPIIDEQSVEEIRRENPHLTKEFIVDYCYWRYRLIKMHPTDFEPYLKYVDFAYVCYACDQISEKYLIDHLDLVDVSALQYNYPVLARLSPSFKKYIIDELIRNKKEINPHFADEIDTFIEDDTYFSEYATIDLLDDELFEEEEEKVDFHFFEFDRGPYKWPGSEHLVKGIPSLASQLYDDMGYKKPTNEEMDEQFSKYNEKQISLISAILEPHWLNRYKDRIDWKAACLYNKHLTDEFLNEHIEYVDFECLGNNLSCVLSEEFIETHMNQFNHDKPVPLIIRFLTVQMYLNHKDKIKVNSDLLFQYYNSIGAPEYKRILDLLDE